MHTRAFAAGLLAAAAPATLAEAQGNSQIVGVVISAKSSIPLAGARVTITRPTGRDTSLLTDDRGRFALGRLAPGRYAIRSSWNGFLSATSPFDLEKGERFEVEFTVGGEPQTLSDPAGAQVLPELTTEGAATNPDEWRTFERRMARGLGQYLTQEQIEDRQAADLSDLMRMLTGIRVSCRSGACIPHIQRAPPGCGPPRFLIDEMEVDPRLAATTSASNIRGVEVYQGLAQVPGELVKDHQQARCGVIAIWTRRGPGALTPR